MRSTAITPSHWLRNRPIAHRGLHGSDAPENSLAAFERAITHRYPIELDVRLLADGSVVVFHDTDAQRLTGVEGPIEDFTSVSLKQLRLLDTQHQVPLLPDVLDLVAGQIGILIEIKNESASVGPLEAAVLQALNGYAGEYALQSFNRDTVRFFADNAHDVIRGQLVSTSAEKSVMDVLQFRAHADFAAYNLASIPNETTDKLRVMTVPLIAWTIKTLEDEARAQMVADNYIFEGLLP